MKRFILLIFTLVILVSCTTNETNIPVITDTVSATVENETDVMTESAEDTSPVSSVSDLQAPMRMEKQYQITHLAQTLPSYTGSNVYQFKDKLYQTAWNNDEEVRRVSLTSWNADGTLDQIRYYAEPEAPLQYVPSYIFPLSDGRSIIMYLIKPDESMFVGDAVAVFCILTEDGTVIHRAEIPEYGYHLRDNGSAIPHIFENEDGTFLIVFSVFSSSDHTYVLYRYDHNLDPMKPVSLDNKQMGDFISRLENGNLRTGLFLSHLTQIDWNHSTSRPLGGIRVPSYMREASVVCAYTDELYFTTDTDVYYYSQNGQPQEILCWTDTPFDYAKIKSSFEDMVWVMDDKNIFVRSSGSVNGAQKSGLFHIAITEVPAADRAVIELAQIGLAQNLWLNDMIYQFNQASTEYKINLTQYPTMSREEGRAQVDSLLLAAHKPDIIYSASGDVFSRHNDKNAYLNLSDALSVRLFGCVDRIHSENGALYQLPLSMTAMMFVSPNTVADQPLTWDMMEQIIQNLGDRELLTSSANAAKMILYPNTLMQFVNESNKESSFDSDAFCQAIRLLDEMNDYVDEAAGQLTNNFMLTSGAYAITNGTLHRRLADGGIKLIRFDFSELESYAALKLLFHEIPFTLCGLPTVTGELCADIQTQKMLSVSADSDVKEGCIAFVELLLSDDAQANLGQIENTLPVTPSAMQKLLDASRYQYYTKEIIHDLIEAPDTGLVYTDWHGVTAEYDLSYGNNAEKADEIYYISSFTEEDDRRIIDFFDHCISYRTDDETILKIVNEELSYWKNDARSLEDTGHIINSRVWIYLNE